jgi:hypothetical protein
MVQLGVEPIPKEGRKGLRAWVSSKTVKQDRCKGGGRAQRPVQRVTVIT